MQKGESPLDDIIQDLLWRAQRAEAVEQQFFAMFNVNNADQWNKKYMGIGLFEGVNLQDRNTRNAVFKNTTNFNVYNKTVLTLNTRGFAYSILKFASSITQESTALNDVMRQALVQATGKGLEKTRQNIFKGNSFQSLITKMTTESGFISGLEGGLGQANVIFRKGVGVHLGGKGLEQSALEKMGRDEVLEYLRANKEGIRKEIENVVKSQYDRGASTLQSHIKKRVTEELNATYFTPEDFGLLKNGDSTEYENTKNAYIQSIANKLSKTIPSKMKSRTIISVSGALGEAVVVTILEEALKEIYQEVKLVVDKARDQVTKKRTGEQFDSFVDLSIKDPKGLDILYNIQVKNTIQETVFRDTGLAIQGGDLHFTKPANFSSLIDDISSRGILSMDGVKDLPYQIVNHYYRYKHGVGSDDFFSQLAMFFAMTAEHFLRSATIEPITRAQDGASAIENHFILRPSMGIVGISSFLRGVVGILESARHNKKSGAVMPIKAEMLSGGNEGEAKDPEQFHKTKLVIAQKFDAEQGIAPGEGSYPQPLRQFGSKVGATLYKSIPAPNIWLSVEYIAQQIHNLGQGGR